MHQTASATIAPPAISAAADGVLADGLDMLDLGRPAEALALADAALAQTPDLVDAHLLRGSACKTLGRFADAIAAFEQVLARQPARAAVLVSLGNAHAELGQLDAAADCLRRALALRPQLTAAHASLISVTALMGRDDLTEAACRAALAADPALVPAGLHLADILDRRGDGAAARTLRDAAYRRQPLFIEPATGAAIGPATGAAIGPASGPAPSVLVLLTLEDGNVPLKYLLPRGRATLLRWLIDYADPGETSDLPAYDVVFNAVGEPDLAAPTHAAIERFRARCDAPFLNPPERVLPTRRTELPRLLAGLADVVAPPVWRRAPGQTATPPVLPALVRPVGAHGGDNLVRAATAEAFAQAVPASGDCYVTAFRDFASSDGLWRKYRVVFVDGRPYPYHLAIGDHWLVHYRSAGMDRHPARRAEEARFLADPDAAIGARAVAAVAAIGERLGLDYAGVDFSLLADGRVLVFEANATMVVHPETPDGPFAYKNRAVQAIIDAFAAMIAARIRRPA